MPQTATIRRATIRDAAAWEGMTLAELRQFVAECGRDQVDDSACIVAVAGNQTTALQGVGFFSMSS
ncbi:hypothetical protein [Dactylosporangium sp. NPDC049140]|uniref:hypothetical protein n=1 Tax=Dactylosporangium sp. NPDC049140 TaxID=3155647 RepID=UPI0034022C26